MENRQSAPGQSKLPEILAPAGDRECFLAALAAGADAIYLGLKNFSARMESENFGLGLLARLLELARNANIRVYVAMNGLIKQKELGQAFRLLDRLSRQAPVDGIILQDLALLDMARQTGFGGQIALSTLANVSSPAALEAAARIGASRVILPRELSIDEIRQMDASCPQSLELECFVHGALCYCVSGRCYWSSYMGGRSGLRGRCAQPCRRVYSKRAHYAWRGDSRKARPASPGGKGERFFSCQDLELGLLARTLLDCRNIISWKIEGRKKGPHYVFHTVTAYKLLRDNPTDPSARKLATEILAQALGRPGVKARFLPQNKTLPMSPHEQTSSGLLAGKIATRQDGACVLKPHFELLPRDYLRIGVEDEKWHATLPVSRAIPKGGSLVLRLAKHKTPRHGTPVYLIDRREPELRALLESWQKRLDKIPPARIRDVTAQPKLPKPCGVAKKPDLLVRSSLRTSAKGENKQDRSPLGRYLPGIWLSRRAGEISRTLLGRMAFWLPPVVWPDGEDAIRKLISGLWRQGARHFVCNAPWQRAYFPDILPEDADLVAGPFCNIANSLALGELQKMGFAAAFASPELDGADILALPAHSPLPLGFVIYGYWPVGLSRFGLVGVNANEPFFSPKNEVFWARDYGGTIWIYPGWPLDLTEKKKELLAAGYSFFACLQENAPQDVPESHRPGLFNWEGSLL